MTSIRRKRWFVLLPMVVATTASVGTLTAARPIPTSACQIAEDWVTAHMGSLPSTPSEFNKLSPSLRRHAYPHLAAEVRINIWRDKLAPYAGTGSSLSEAQRAYVRKFIAALPALVSDTTGAAGRRVLTSTNLETEGKQLFEAKQFRDLFATLGSAVSQSPHAALEDCDCDASGSDDCEDCIWGGATCQPIIIGCGTGGLSVCDGVCLL